ncbi:MAG: cation:proton antiporter, partial [Bacteroidales bacterium]|nr:cation:proton antiporter [Bacteroidales bacterium]
MERFISDLSHHFAMPFTNPVLVFALLLFIVLVSPILLKRLNVPSIIGLILAGVLIGPHGLNFIQNGEAM